FTGQQSNAAGVGASDLTYYFPERHFRTSQGRWASPDPGGLGAVDMSDPQTLNRYAYVRNSPLNAIDPEGLDGWDEWGGGGWGGSINISFGSGGFNIGGGIWGSMNCMGVPCGNSAIVQAAQAVAQAIKTRNWAS